MWTIDRYVMRLFVKVLVVCFMSLTGLFIVIDAFGNLDELLTLGDKHGSLVGVLCEYYGARALAFFDRTSALIALVAATFAVTTMQRSNELAALQAAGISKARLVRPLIVGTIVVSLLAVANREWLIPRYRDQLSRRAQDWEGTAQRDFTPRFDHFSDILLMGRATVAADQRIVQPTFRLPPGLSRFGSQLAAHTAWFRDAEPGRPRGYLLEGVQEPKNLAGLDSCYRDGQPLVLSPKDTPWLKPQQCFVVSDVTFEQLAAGNTWRQFSSTAELILGLHNPSLDCSADVRVAVHARLIQPFLDVVLLFLGLPLVLSRESRNIFFSAGLCVAVVAAFFLTVLTCQTLGNNYLIRPAALAAWCPLLIFAPLARLSAQAFWR
jgi:lipopolysaccharide export system permease protein